jgi:signal transduction histidine kinase
MSPEAGSPRVSDGGTRSAPGPRLLRALTRLVELAASEDDESGFFHKLSAALADLATARRAAVWCLGPDDRLRPQPVAHNIALRIIEATAPVPCAPGRRGLLDQVVYRGRVFCSNLERDAALIASYERQMDVGADNAIVVPLAVRGDRLGVVAVYDSTRPGGFGEEDVMALQLAAKSASLAWQQRRLRAQLRAGQEEESRRINEHVGHLADVERIKSDILNLTAHELRAPITVFRGYLSMVGAGDLADMASVRQVVPVLLGKVDEMTAVVEKMLANAKVEEGQLRLDTARIDLRHPVRAAVDQTRGLAGPRHWVILETDPRPVWVLGDAEALTTIVGNLITNAIKYSPDGGEVRCSVRWQGEVATVRVTDHGLGIAAADMPRLFTRFGRIITSDNSNIAGIGLGLYYCQELALLHGGAIEAESTPGSGSTFSLSLPLQHEAEPSVPEPPHGLQSLSLAQLFACCRHLRAVSGATEDERAGVMLRYLFENLVTPGGEPACALLRLFKVEPYRSLPPALRALVKADLADREPPSDAVFVRLLASVGAASPSMDPATCTGRLFQVSAQGEVANRSPILSWVLDERRIRLARAVAGERLADVADRRGIKGLLHIEHPVGSGMVPDQDFVRRGGIRSVVGCAETLPRGNGFGFVLYSKVPVGAPVAQLLRGAVYSMRLGLQAVGAQS